MNDYACEETRPYGEIVASAGRPRGGANPRQHQALRHGEHHARAADLHLEAALGPQLDHAIAAEECNRRAVGHPHGQHRTRDAGVRGVADRAVVHSGRSDLQHVRAVHFVELCPRSGREGLAAVREHRGWDVVEVEVAVGDRADPHVRDEVAALTEEQAKLAPLRQQVEELSAELANLVTRLVIYPCQVNILHLFALLGEPEHISEAMELGAKFLKSCYGTPIEICLDLEEKSPAKDGYLDV